MKQKFVVVAYDITSNRRRTRVARYLQTYGSRINLSVFECTVPVSELEKFKHTVVSLIHSSTDTVVFYDLCLNCVAAIDRRGLGGRPAHPSSL